MGFNSGFKGLTIAAVEIKNITHSGFVSVALVTHHAKRMRHVIICGLPSSTIFFYTILEMARISG